MAVLLTGAAGFIGFHVAEALLSRGEDVIGIDNLNPYYSVKLKQDRLARLEDRTGFRFHCVDLADAGALDAALNGVKLDGIIHLAAQAGVRYSLEAPMTYVSSNLVGHMTILELARRQESCRHLVYASSSSVYGGNRKLPFSESDAVDNPVSLYAAIMAAFTDFARFYVALLAAGAGALIMGFIDDRRHISPTRRLSAASR